MMGEKTLKLLSCKQLLMKFSQVKMMGRKLHVRPKSAAQVMTQ